MKKLVVLALAGVLFVGCGSAPPETATETTQEAVEETTVTEESEAEDQAEEQKEEQTEEQSGEQTEASEGAAEQKETDVLTIDNNEELKELLTGGEDYDKSRDFAEKYKGKEIEFDGSIDYFTSHDGAKTRYDILLSAGDYSEDSQTSPTFKFEDVNTFNLNISGGDASDVVYQTANVHVNAIVDRFDYDHGIFYITPVSVAKR